MFKTTTIADLKFLMVTILFFAAPALIATGAGVKPLDLHAGYQVDYAAH